MRFRTLLLILALAGLPACAALEAPAPPPARWSQETPDILFQRAESAYRRQHYQVARELFFTYLRRYPQGARATRAQLREAELTGLLGDWPSSLQRYQAILTQTQNYETGLEARFGIGRAYYRMGDYPQALTVLESLTASDLPGPLRFSVNALLAEIALKQGQIEPAFARLRLAHQDLAAGDAEWFEFLKSRLTEQATPEELERLSNLYRDSSLSAALLLRLAQVAEKNGRPDEARRWLNTLKERYPESAEAQATGRRLTPPKVLVGCLVPQTGSYAEPGRRLRQGMELAAQGSSLDLLFKDSPNDPGQAAQAVRDLAQHQHLLAIVGPLTSGDAQAAAQAAQEAGIPLIGFSQKADLTQTGSFIFQAFLTPRAQVRELVRYGLSRGLKRFAVFAPDSTYGRTFSLLLSEELAAQGGEMAARESYPAGTRDFSLALSPLLSAYQIDLQSPPAFEAVFVPDDAPTVAAILSQSADTPLGKVQFLGTNLAHPGATQDQDLKTLEGLVFTDAFFPGNPDPGVQSFITAYRQRFGEAPDYLAAQGYMVVRLLSELVAKEGAVPRTELPLRLLAWKTLPGLPWFMGFTPERLMELRLYLLTIKDGQVRPATAAR